MKSLCVFLLIFSLVLLISVSPSSAATITLVANSTMGSGFHGTLTTNRTSNNRVVGSEITAKMVLTSANLTAFSSWDGMANSVTSAGGNPDVSHTTTLQFPIIGLVL